MNPIDYAIIKDKTKPANIKEWALLLLKFFLLGMIFKE